MRLEILRIRFVYFGQLLSADHLQEYSNVVPNLSMSSDTDSMEEKASQHMLVLLTLEDLQLDSELFCDYRLDVDGVSEGPVWYTAVHDPHLPQWAASHKQI